MSASDEPAKRRLTPRRAVLAAVFLGALVLAVPFASPQIRSRAHVWWLLRGISSKDADVREEARRRILALGRPAMDPAYPQLVAQAVEEACARARERDAVIFVGRAVAEEISAPRRAQGYGEIDALAGDLPRSWIWVEHDPRWRVQAILLEETSWLERPAPACKELIVGTSNGDGEAPRLAELRLGVAARVDDDLAPAVVAAVKDAISRMSRYCHGCGEGRPRFGDRCPHCGAK